jgi:hypothetical protein
MIFNIQHTANWEYICARKQRLIQKNNKNENKSRVPHTYHVDDKVMLRKGTKNKYEAPFSGPHKILKVNTNGTVRLRVGSVTDTVNIRRIEPYPIFISLLNVLLKLTIIIHQHFHLLFGMVQAF